MKLDEFDFQLPPELIAQEPPAKRGSSRLMLLERSSGAVKHELFKNIAAYFKEGDLLIRNATRVVPARVFGRKRSGAGFEILILNKKAEKGGTFLCKTLARPGSKLKEGDVLYFENSNGASARFLKREGESFYFLFDPKGDFNEFLNRVGHMPLPKYIKKELKDKNKYQTIYAKEGESAAAPTAGLHFSEEIFKELSKKGVEILDINLNIGLGTFAPIRVENINEHKMHEEDFSISESVAHDVNEAKKEGREVVALGTTSLRALESAFDAKEGLLSGEFKTDIFIKPAYKFKVVDALITNFHLPKSSLLILLSAFAGRENVLSAYKEAIKERYRFFSFGDAMFVRDFSKFRPLF